MKTYYVVFTSNKMGSTIKSWRIRLTENNMDTHFGLMNEIEAIENEEKSSVAIEFWKELDIN